MRPAPGVFMIAYSAAYAFTLAMDWPLFRYYPLHGILNWGAGNLKGIGPAITWYGLMADSIIFASILALLVPDRALGRVVAHAWIFPAGAIAVTLYLMRIFF